MLSQEAELGQIALLNNLAIIMPDGENHFYVDDLRRNDMYSEMIGHELVELTRHMFPLSDKREDTILGGISMGGYGALRNGMKYSDVFGHIIGLSPANVIDQLPSSTETPNEVGATRSYFTSVFGDLDTVHERDADLEVCAKEMLASRRPIPDIYFACGWNDMLCVFNRKFHGFLKTIGVNHIYREGPGTHDSLFFMPHLHEALARIDLDRLPELPNPFLVDMSGGTPDDI